MVDLLVLPRLAKSLQNGAGFSATQGYIELRDEQLDFAASITRVNIIISRLVFLAFKHAYFIFSVNQAFRKYRHNISKIFSV